MDAPIPVPLETLLAHREWVRRVALALVRDENLAEDLEQDLWVKAVERPPVVRGSLRGWLAAALRNAAVDGFRSESGRRRRERALARPERERSAADVVAEADALRRVVGAVMDLEEPARSAVLLRFFEGLPPRGVAARQGVPVETVRTRLRRALADLRERLGREGGGGRLAALLPGTGLAAGPGSAAGNAGAGVAGALGGTAMTAKAAILAGAGLGLAGGLLGSLFLAPGPPEDLLRRVARLEAAGDAPGAGAGGAARPVGDGESARDRRLLALEAEVAALRKGHEALAARPAGAGRAPGEAAAEVRGLADLSSEELLAEIRRLSRARYGTREEARAGHARTLLACEEFLGRPSEPSQRVEVLTAKGLSRRETGDLDGAEAALREALGLAGPATNEGRGVTYHLALVASVRKDGRGAADLLLGVARQAEAPPEERAKFRYWAATYLEAADRAGALAELRGLVDEHGASEDRGIRHWVEQARREIGRMERAEAGGEGR